MKLDYERLNRRYGGWVSLALGLLTLLVVRRGASYAPVAVGLVIVAFTLSAVLSRWLPEPAGAAGGTPGRRLRALMRAFGGSVAVGLYQNVLFYLLPIWFGSSTWPSANVVFPCLLAAMALFSCFEYPYRALVLDRPAIRATFSAVVLFAALVPAGTVPAVAPLRVHVAAAAVIASIAAAALLFGDRLRTARGALSALLVAAAGTALLAVAAPILPPVPIVCVDSGAGTGVEARELTGKAEEFRAGIPRVYAWFAIAAPARWRESVRFEWRRDGELLGRPIESVVVGGRAAGFRTWSWSRSPLPGDWRADLVTDGGQLIGRVRFRVE